MCRIFLFFALLSFAEFNAFSAKEVTVYGLPGCIELKNEKNRVVVDPNIGGRILVYEYKGRDVLYFNHAHDGITDGSKIKRIDAGRFDFGPVKTIPSHNMYLKGRWEAEITGERLVRLTSRIDPRHNILLVRDFTLDDKTSKLTCRQTLINKGEIPLKRYLWSRTFVKGGGVYIMSMNESSRYKKGYVAFVDRDDVTLMDYMPREEPDVTIEDGFLIMSAPSVYKRTMTDGDVGILVALYDNNIMFLKKYQVYPEKKYGGISCFTTAVWHLKDEIYEIEPMGPVENVAPGDSISFTEMWYLAGYPFPEDRKPDVDGLKQKIETLTGVGE